MKNQEPNESPLQVNSKVLVYTNKKIFTGVIKYILHGENRVFVERQNQKGYLQEVSMDSIFEHSENGLAAIESRVALEQSQIDKAILEFRNLLK